MRFSVLISIYYKENPDFLKLALESVWDTQTLKPSEIVIVKDGALTEALDAVIVSFSESAPVKIIALPENVGLGVALNEGIKHCTCEWIARMDADDICFPDRFQKQIAVIEQNEKISFLSSSIAEFTVSTDEINSYRKLPELHEDIHKYAKFRCPMNHPVVMYKKQSVLDCGGYREFPEDYHLWVRALMKGYKFYNIQEPLLYFRTNIDTIKRRGGWKYAVTEFSHQKEFYRIGFINYVQFLKNIFSRFVARIVPSNIRKYLYSAFLRSKRK